MQWANSADDRLMIFLLFFLELGFDISCRLFSKTVCMKCEILFSRKNKKVNSKCILSFYPACSVKWTDTQNYMYV